MSNQQFQFYLIDSTNQQCQPLGIAAQVDPGGSHEPIALVAGCTAQDGVVTVVFANIASYISEFESNVLTRNGLARNRQLKSSRQPWWSSIRVSLEAQLSRIIVAIVAALSPFSTQAKDLVTTASKHL